MRLISKIISNHELLAVTVRRASVAGKRELKRGRALVLQGLEPEAVAGHHIHVFGCDATVGGGSEASERIAGCEETSLDAVHVGFVFNPFSGKYYIYNRSTNGAGTTLVRMKKVHPLPQTRARVSAIFGPQVPVVCSYCCAVNHSVHVTRPVAPFPLLSDENCGHQAGGTALR